MCIYILDNLCIAERLGDLSVLIGCCIGYRLSSIFSFCSVEKTIYFSCEARSRYLDTRHVIESSFYTNSG